MKKYAIKLNGKVYEVEIEEVTGESATTVIESEKVIQRNAPPQNLQGVVMEAPMPGNILNILVKEGQQVKKDEVLLILEAMKMENEIVSPVDGKIGSINVSKGQNVKAGDIFLQIL